MFSLVERELPLARHLRLEPLDESRGVGGPVRVVVRDGDVAIGFGERD